MTPAIHKLPERFRMKVNHHTETDCWLWTGGGSGNGYGKVSVSGRMKMVHRVVYELFLGPIPDGLVLDHLCGNRGCCNPLHMEPVTVQENTRRGEAFLFGVLQ